MSFDVVVVGGGTAGCALVARLSWRSCGATTKALVLVVRG